MKQSIAAAVVVLLAVGLVGCASQSDAAVSPAAPVESNLRVLKQGDAAGFYINHQLTDGRWLRSYIDCETAQMVPVCAVPNCAHNDPTCTAYVEPQNTSNTRIIGSDRVLVWDKDKKGQSVIGCSKADGSEYRELVRSKSGQYLEPFLTESGEGEVLCDAQYYYLMLAEEREGTSQKSLCRGPLAGGELEKLDTIPEGNLLGVQGRNLVMYHYEWPETFGSEKQEEKEQISQNSVYLYNVDTAQKTELDAWTATQTAGVRNMVWNNDILYWYEDQHLEKIEWLNANGERGERTVAYPEPLQPVENEIFSGIEGVLDDQLLVQISGCWENGKQKRFAVDLKSGTAAEIPLQYVANARQRPVAILAQTQQQLLLEFEGHFENRVFISADGIPQPYDAYVPRMGLISREDFLAGKPNYRQINIEAMG